MYNNAYKGKDTYKKILKKNIYYNSSFLRGISRFKLCGKHRMSYDGLNQLFRVEIKFNVLDRYIKFCEILLNYHRKNI